MIPALLVAALAVAALAFVAAPVRKRPTATTLPLGEVESELQAKKRAALGAILDLEEERELGKLAEVDFTALRAEYERQALLALAELDAMSARAESDDALEAEIADMRHRMTCQTCGALRIEGEHCARCGA